MDRGQTSHLFLLRHCRTRSEGVPKAPGGPRERYEQESAAGKLKEPHPDKEQAQVVHVLQVSEDCPYVEIHIGTHPFRSLLDTGAQLSLVSKEFLELCDPKLVKSAENVPDIALRSATGHSLEVTGRVKIRITLGKVRMYHDFVVIKDFKHDMILGIDFLKARKAIIDFESHTLVIGNAVYPVKSRPDQNEVNLVKLAEDVAVPPRSGMQVKCYIPKKRQAG